MNWVEKLMCYVEGGHEYEFQGAYISSNHNKVHVHRCKDCCQLKKIVL
jgi:hypothetical protein